MELSKGLAWLGLCRLACVFCLLCPLMIGCAYKARYRIRSEVAREVEQRYGEVQLRGVVLDKWWEVYADPSLNRFVESVLEKNLTLKAAYLNLIDAQLAIKTAQSGKYPGISGNLSSGLASKEGEPKAIEKANQSYQASLSLSYELDLWGKVSAGVRIAELSEEIVRDSIESSSMTLLATAVSSYFYLSYLQEKRQKMEALKTLLVEQLELLKIYQRQGQALSVDVLEAEDALRSAELELQTQTWQERQGRLALSILNAGQSVEVEGVLPQALTEIGMPDWADFLLRRADLRTARRQAEQANARIAIAWANRLPSLRLGGSTGLKASSFGEFLSGFFWNLSVGLVADIFDGFKQRSELARAKLGLVQQQYRYTQAVLEATLELERALAQLEIKREQGRYQQRALEDAALSLEQQRLYYLSGQLTADRLISQLKRYQTVLCSELEARYNILLAEIELFKAMGSGAWLEARHEGAIEAAKEVLENFEEDQKLEPEE